MPIRARWALAGAAACVALLFASWYAAFHVSALIRADQTGYVQFVGLRHHDHVQGVTDFFVSLGDLLPYLLLAGGVILIALVRQRPWLAFGAVAILLGANVTTQLLKTVMAQQRPEVFGVTLLPPSSWPSGHTTAAMALGLSLMLVVPPRLRGAAAALAAAFAVAVGYSMMATGNHFPSDVLGGLLVASAWALLTVAALAADERQPLTRQWSPTRVSLRAALGPPGALLLGAVVLVAVVGLIHPHEVFSWIRAHGSLVGAAVAIAALSLGLSTGAMLAVRH